MAHPWHDFPIGYEKPYVNAVIEIPKGCKIKYELDTKTGLLKVDRILYSSVVYPNNYGFIPQTLDYDGDPLDILVLMQEPVQPLSCLRAKPIGVMKMLDQGAVDDKIISVHADDPEYNTYNDISELPPHRLLEVKRFFEDYKKNENKQVIVEEFLPKEEAFKVIDECVEIYKDYIKRQHPEPQSPSYKSYLRLYGQRRKESMEMENLTL